MDDREFQQNKPVEPVVTPTASPLPVEVEPPTVSTSPSFNQAVESTEPAYQPTPTASIADAAMPSISTVPGPSLNSEQPNMTSVSSFSQSPTPKRKKKAMIAGIIVAGVLVVLGGGGALAYNFWYQNPQKVVSDSIIHAIAAKSVVYTGSIATSGDQKFKLEVTGSSKPTANQLEAKITGDIGGKSYTFTGSAIVAGSGDLYVQFKDIDTLVKNYIGDMPSETKTLVDKIVQKINNQWIKISVTDLSTFNESYAKVQSCTSDIMKKMESDNSLTAEIGDFYKKNQFITIEKELGSKDGSLGYSLGADSAKAKAFYVSLKDSRLYKMLHDCDSTIEINEKDLSDSANTNDKGHVELWVSRWSHEITKLTADSDIDGTKTNVLVEPKFNEKTDIKAPEKSTTLKQLQSDLEELLQSALGSIDTSPNMNENDTASVL